MTHEEFIANSANTKTYRIEQLLPGESSFAIGDKVASSVLYDNGYNILKLVEQGYLRSADEPYEWQKELIGKNEKSVYVRCGACQSWGINFPMDTVCGNCGYAKGTTYYDAHTIDMLIRRIQQLQTAR